MLKPLRQLFDLLQAPADKDTKPNRETMQLAAAALMLEVASVDQQLDGRELGVIRKRLQEQLQLPENLLQEMLDHARTQQSQATSLYEFTRLINDYFSAEEKLLLIEDMWSVAYADDEIDKYEEYVIRRVAELIYVAHSDFIRCKITVREKRG